MVKPEEIIKDELYNFSGNIDMTEKFTDDTFVNTLFDEDKGIDIFVCDDVTARFGVPINKNMCYIGRYYDGYVYVLNYDKSFGKYYHKISADLFDKVYK